LITRTIDGYWETIWIDPGHDTDIEHAVRAKVNVEKILCHDGTTGLGIKINEDEWIDIPEADSIPAPQSLYQHHVYSGVEIPLDVLKSGTGNRFKMRVSEKHSWNWLQNLVYGVHIRVYYKAAKKPHPTGSFSGLSNGDQLSKSVRLAVTAESPNGNIKRVDFSWSLQRH